MTMTRDKDSHYKYYFLDQDGKRIDDLEFRLSDIRITEKALFKRLELDHNLKKLQTTAQTMEIHLKNDTDSFEKGTAKTITSHLEKNVVQEKLANSLSQNAGFMQNVKDNAGTSPSAVAESLLESKGPDLGDAILHAIENNDGNAATVLSRLARDINLQTKIAENLKQDTTFQGRIKGKDGEAGLRGLPGAKGESPTPESVADELLHPSKDALIHRLMFNEIVNPGGDITPKTLKEKLAIDQTFSVEVAAKLFEQPVQLGRAVLSVKDAGQKSELAMELARDDTFKKDVGDLLEGNIEDVVSLPRMARSIQEIEEKMEGEERKILEAKRIADEKAVECARHAESARNAANESEEYAERSKTAADLSEKHALRSETAAGKSEGHEIKAKEHRENAEISSSNAAAFADNEEESAVCAKNPLLSQCLSSSSLSRSRREAIWEESEDQTFQHENLDSISLISI